MFYSDSDVLIQRKVQVTNSITEAKRQETNNHITTRNTLETPYALTICCCPLLELPFDADLYYVGITVILVSLDGSQFSSEYIQQ